MKIIVIKAVTLAFIFSLAIVRPAFAYVDPNVGGMLFQVLAAGFAVASGIILLFSRQIRTALARVRRSRRSDDAVDSDTSTGTDSVENE
jgi:hypothetical protein